VEDYERHGLFNVILMIQVLLLVAIIAIGSADRLMVRRVGANVAAVAFFAGTPMSAFGVGLGEHTNCAYPACSSKIEILEANNVNLVSDAELESYLSSLKEIKNVFDIYPKLVAEKDYASMRGILRASPAGGLRLTARKYRAFLPETQRKDFLKAYEKMIESLDDMDVIVFKRMQDSSSDEKLVKAVDTLLSNYAAMLATVDVQKVPP